MQNNKDFSSKRQYAMSARSKKYRTAMDHRGRTAFPLQGTAVKQQDQEVNYNYINKSFFNLLHSNPSILQQINDRSSILPSVSPKADSTGLSCDASVSSGSSIAPDRTDDISEEDLCPAYQDYHNFSASNPHTAVFNDYCIRMQGLSGLPEYSTTTNLHYHTIPADLSGDETTLTTVEQTEEPQHFLGPPIISPSHNISSSSSSRMDHTNLTELQHPEQMIFIDTSKPPPPLPNGAGFLPGYISKDNSTSIANQDINQSSSSLAHANVQQSHNRVSLQAETIVKQYTSSECSKVSNAFSKPSSSVVSASTTALGYSQPLNTKVSSAMSHNSYTIPRMKSTKTADKNSAKTVKLVADENTLLLGLFLRTIAQQGLNNGEMAELMEKAPNMEPVQLANFIKHGLTQIDPGFFRDFIKQDNQQEQSPIACSIDVSGSSTGTLTTVANVSTSIHLPQTVTFSSTSGLQQQFPTFVSSYGSQQQCPTATSSYFYKSPIQSHTVSSESDQDSRSEFNSPSYQSQGDRTDTGSYANLPKINSHPSGSKLTSPSYQSQDDRNYTNIADSYQSQDVRQTEIENEYVRFEDEIYRSQETVVGMVDNSSTFMSSHVPVATDSPNIVSCPSNVSLNTTKSSYSDTPVMSSYEEGGSLSENHAENPVVYDSQDEILIQFFSQMLLMGSETLQQLAGGNLTPEILQGIFANIDPTVLQNLPTSQDEQIFFLHRLSQMVEIYTSGALEDFNNLRTASPINGQKRSLPMHYDDMQQSKMRREMVGDSDHDIMQNGTNEKFHCQLCNVSCLSVQEFDQHMHSEVHQQRMASITSLYQARTEQQIQRMKAEEVLRRVEQASDEKCEICLKKMLRESLQEHIHGQEHIRKERLTKRGCILCKTGRFDNYPNYVAHIDSDAHKQAKEVLNKEKKKLTDSSSSSSTTSSSNHTGNKSSEERANIRGKDSTPRSNGHQSVVKTEVVQQPDAQEVDMDIIQVDLSYDPDTPVGQSFVIPVKGFFCKLCHKFYNNEDMAKNAHCKSERHFEKYQEYVVSQQQENDAPRSQKINRSSTTKNPELTIKISNDHNESSEVQFQDNIDSKDTMEVEGNKPAGGSGDAPSRNRGNESKARNNSRRKLSK